VLGVVIVGVSLSPMESVWIDSTYRPENEKPFVVDEHGVVIMSSVPYWKFKSATATPGQHSPPQLDHYPVSRIEPLEMSIDKALAHGAHLVSLRLAADAAPTQHVVHERSIARLGWRLLIASDPSDIRRGARQAAWAAGAGVAFAGLLLLYLIQRSRVIRQKLAARDELERKVAQRTAELRREIAEREHAEQVLREAQAELVQAGKLALVGQLAAGVSHEIGQPLTALDALAENTRLLLARGEAAAASENLATIASLVQRMGRITGQLKSFVRKTDRTAGPVRLIAAVENARRLIELRLQQDGVGVDIDVAPELRVQCDGNRLEQVLLNLMTNALDAMHDSATRRLGIRAWRDGERVTVRVSDTGPGIARDVRERLFEPFFTTKPPGQGLGLGLVISGNIVQEFGGALRAVDAKMGAAFEFDLAIAEDTRV
jgi:two-component system C4-dicarboxylate transport sensor histidine kinase DctB